MDERGGAGKGSQSGGQEGSANGASANQGGISVPDFLPPAQRVLFMRIQQKQQEEEERARRMAEGGAEKSRDTEGRGETPGSVSVILFVIMSCGPPLHNYFRHSPFIYIASYTIFSMSLQERCTKIEKYCRFVSTYPVLLVIELSYYMLIVIVFFC